MVAVVAAAANHRGIGYQGKLVRVGVSWMMMLCIKNKHYTACVSHLQHSFLFFFL